MKHNLRFKFTVIIVISFSKQDKLLKLHKSKLSSSKVDHPFMCPSYFVVVHLSSVGVVH